MPKYIIYDNGFTDVHVLKFNTEDQGIPVYEHYRHVKKGFSAAQDLVRSLEAGTVKTHTLGRGDVNKVGGHKG